MYLAVQLASMSDERLEPQGHWCCIAIRLAMEILSGMHGVVVKDIVQAIIMLSGFAQTMSAGSVKTVNDPFMT